MKKKPLNKHNEKLQKNGLYDFADLLIKLNDLLNKKDIKIIGINRISILKMEKYYELKREYPTSIAGEYENLLNRLHCIIDGMKLNSHIDFIPTIEFMEK